MDWLISHLPSGFTLFLASGTFLIGLGLLIYQYFFVVPYRILALGLGIALISSSMYLSGAGNNQAIQERLRLEAQLAKTEKALELSNKLAVTIAKDNEQAAKDFSTLEDLNKRGQDAINKTDHDLVFNTDDVKRLRSLWD